MTDLTELLKLPVAERLQLVEDLWDSIAADTSEPLALTQAQRAELQARLEEHRSDPGSAVPWEQVRAELLSSEATAR